MARIPEEEIERIKREVSLEQLARSRGIKLEKRGDDLVGLCPFHEETTPSCVISPATNLFHCFGCGAAGNVIQFLMKLDGLSFPQAIAKLGGTIDEQSTSSGPPRERPKRKVEPRA